MSELIDIVSTENTNAQLINRYNNMFYNNNNNIQFQELLKIYDRYLLLQLSISRDLPNYNEVFNRYTINAKQHNTNILNNFFPDAGFNLFTTENASCVKGDTIKLDFGVQCAGTIITDTNRVFPSGFYMYPRSSTGSKTGLRLANSVGIIDSGYRGNLMAVFDSNKTENMPQYTSLVQICGPSLIPLLVVIVEEMDNNTERGTCGFGSTGV
jgi:dUTP pyrophosphatase